MASRPNKFKQFLINVEIHDEHNVPYFSMSLKMKCDRNKETNEDYAKDGGPGAV